MLEDGGWQGLATKWYPRVVLFLIAILAAFIRFEMLGRYAGLPSADHGNYLVSVNALIGRDVTGYGLEYPPLFFVLLVGLLQLFGPILAVRLGVVAASFSLPFPFYALVRRTIGPPGALLAAGLLTFSEAYSEMTAWGGGPDFLAIVLMLSSMVFLLRYLEAGSRRDMLIASAFASLAVGTHQLTALVYAATIVVWAALEFATRRNVSRVFQFAYFGGATILLSLPYAILYASLSSRLAPQITPLWPDGVDGTWRGFVFVFRDSILLWSLWIVLAAAGLFMLVRERRPEGLMWVSMILSLGVLALTVLRDNPARPLYYLVLPIAGAAPVFLRWAWVRMPLDVTPQQSKVASAMMVASVLLAAGTMTAQSIQRMSIAVDWYHAIDRPELDALDWLRTNTSRSAVIATSGLPLLDQPEGNRYGWWIEGYAERKSFYTGSPAIYTFREQRTQVDLANRFFLGNAVEQNRAIRLIENAPADQNNPGIYLRRESIDRILLYLNDGVTYANYSLASSPTQNRSFYGYPDGVASIAWTSEGGNPGIDISRSTTDVILRRVEHLVGNEALLEIAASVVNGTLAYIEVPLWVGSGLILKDVQTSGGLVRGNLTEPGGISVLFNIAAVASAGATVTVEAMDLDPEFLVPVLRYKLSAAPAVASASLQLTIGLPTLGIQPEEITETVDGLQIARDAGLTHVFQARKLYDEFQRFLADSVHFTVVFQNPEIVIFQFRPV